MGRFTQAHGATCGDPRFAVFPFWTDGFAAMRALLLSAYVGLTVEAALNKWAPLSRTRQIPTSRMSANGRGSRRRPFLQRKSLVEKFPGLSPDARKNGGGIMWLRQILIEIRQLREEVHIMSTSTTTGLTALTSCE